MTAIDAIFGERDHPAGPEGVGPPDSEESTGPADPVEPDGVEPRTRRRTEPSRHRAEPMPTPRGRWIRPAVALALPLVGLPVLALPANGPGQLLDSFDLLTGDIHAGAVGALLLLILWGLWIQLAACVVVEVISALRGSGLPPRVPIAAGRQQDFARRHVGRLLVAASPDRRFQPDRYQLRAFRRLAGTSPEPPEVDPMESAAVEAQRLRQARRQRPPLLRWDVVDASVMSAGLLDALTARRQRSMLARAPGRMPVQPDAEAVGIEVAARVGADRAGTHLVDRALRVLSGWSASTGRPPLRILAVRLTADAVEVLLTEGRTDLPEPFEASDGGRSWSLARSATLPAVPLGPAPSPALVSLGGDGVGRVLVDLTAGYGVCCVAGDRNAARSVVAAAAVELVTAPWAEGSTVTVVGFGDQLGPLGGGRLHCAESLADVVDDITDRLSEARQHAGQVPTEVVILAAPPTEEDLADLTGWFLPAPQRSPLAVLVTGEVPDAEWRFELNREGVLDTGPLGHPVGAQAISARTFAALGRLVQADGEDEPADLRSQPPSRPVDLDAVRVLVQLFGGPPAVRGDVGPGTDLGVEIIAYTALHDVVTLSELAVAVWPRGVADSVRNEAVRRTQWWLGLDSTGRPRLVLEDGALRLSEEVQTDWDVSVALLDRGDVAAAVDLFAGEPMAAPPDGRYTWLPREPLARRIGAVVADRLAAVAGSLMAAGRPVDAGTVVLAGLRVSPFAGALWDALEAASVDDESRAEVRAVRTAHAASLPF